MVFIVITLIKTAIIAFVLLTVLAYLQWVERKVIAHVQVRMGPSRVGPHGLLQPLADVIKLITKEGVMPPHVNSFFYLLAPFLAVFMALISISVIPFGTQLTIGPVHHHDAADRRECRHSVHPRHQFDGRLRHRARRMVVEQQVRASRRPAQFGADDQLRIADESRDRLAAADRRHAEPARNREFAGRVQLRDSFRSGRFSPGLSRRYSASSFS